MSYERIEDYEPEYYGYWLPNGGAVLVKTRAGLVYRKVVEPRGLVTFLEAAALLKRLGTPVSRIAVYQWAKNGKIPFERIRLKPDVRPVAMIRLSVLRKFGKQNDFELDEDPSNPLEE